MSRIIASSMFRLAVTYALLFAVLSLFANHFLTGGNFANIGRAVAVFGMAALGVTVALVAGALDVSFPAIMSLCGIVAAERLQAGTGVVIAIAIAIGTGLLLGAINGIVATALRVDPLIVTLGTLSVFGGWAYYHTAGSEVQASNHVLERIGGGTFAQVPISVWVLLVSASLLGAVLRFTTFGQRVYAVGDNPRAAALAGIHVGRVRIAALMLSGLTAAVGGLLLAGSQGQIFAGDGQTYLLSTIAAVVLGGTSLSGGSGAIIGTVIGIALLGTINNGLDLLHVSTYWQDIVSGAIVVLALMIDRIRRTAL
jgi:ribose transport system permease protein